MTASPSARLYIGCPLWAHKGWVGGFYPPRTPASEYLREYGRRLTAVEGNTTFYAVPSAETVARWAAQTPETFRFCFKVPQTISHMRRLRDSDAETRAFLERLSPLGPRLGPLFVQLPPSFAPDQRSILDSYLSSLPADLPACVEVRHAAWFTAGERARLNGLLTARGAARVVIDTRPIRQGETDDAQLARARERKPDVPIQPDLTAGFAFVRLVCAMDDTLNEPYYAEWTERIAAWLAAGIAVYLFIHCPDEDYSPAYARALYARIAARAGLPPLPDADERPRQGSLL